LLGKNPARKAPAVTRRRTPVDRSAKRSRFFPTVKVTKVVSSAVLLFSWALSGCGSILGIEEKHQSGSTGETSCPLVTDVLPAVRVMNAIPDSAALDLCHKNASNGNYGSAWFAPNRKSCGEGVAYTQFTRDLAIDAGTYDFKLVPAGSGCNAAGIEVLGVVIEATSSVTLMAYGTNLATARISTLPNLTQSPSLQPVRFVHALNNAGLTTAGLIPPAALAAPTAPTAPTVISTPLFVDVEYGRAARGSNGPSPSNYDYVDDKGYSIQGGSGHLDLSFGVSVAPSVVVELSAPIPTDPGHAYTVFAIGTRGQTQPRPKLWSCDEAAHNGLFLVCGNPNNLAVEVFNSNLTDGFTPRIGERTGPAIEAILAEDTDLLCVTELYDPVIVQQLKDGASSKFPHRLFSNDIPAARTTAMTTTSSGTTPTYPPVACPGTYAAGLAQWFDCAKSVQNCTMTGDNGETVFVTPGETAVGCMFACGATGPARDMIGEIQDGGNPAAGSCYWCGITHLASYESFEATIRQCTSEVPIPDRSHMAFGGSSGLAVFSREAALGEPELVLLPSSGWQRAAMRVPVTLKNGAVFDYWCSTVRYPNNEYLLSYAGAYGTWGTSGSAEEQALEVADAVAAINARAQASGVPAIVGMVTHAGPSVVDPTSKKTLVYPFSELVFNMMEDWPELVASDYTPACTYCGDYTTNPLNSEGGQHRFWTTHLFGIGVSPSAVESTERTFMDATITMKDASNKSFMAPVSQHYGLRSVVTMTQ